MKQDYQNKTILVTGGVDGIGFECAKRYQLLGAEVIVTCNSKSSYEKFLSSKEKKNIKVFKLDLTNKISIEKLYEKIDNLDILINNAALYKGGIEYRIENFADVVNVNLMGLMRICHTFLPKLALSSGNIVNISSINSKLSMSKSPSYSATKSAVEALTKSLASCWANHKVRVNCVAPGWIKSNTLQKILKENMNSNDILKRIPLGRFGLASEVSEAVLFLTSTSASYITGTTIKIDGGYSIY